MIVCQCAVVSSGDIADAVDAGCRTVSDVCRLTGAAQSCGTCVFSVRQVVCEHVAVNAETEEAVRAAS
jgi:NAD(P)H-nitrite reductase large subunit